MVKELFGDVVNVNLVDFGQNMTVNSGCIRSITPKLLKLPFQAVRCWLTGKQPENNQNIQVKLLPFNQLLLILWIQVWSPQDPSGRVKP